MSSIPSVPLGEVAKPIQRPVDVVPGTAYRTLGVKWWGAGAYERDTIDGGQTAAGTLYEVQQDDLIINKIWVRHGSVAIVGPEVQGCTGSNEFPTFALDRQKVLPRWVHWYTKTRDLWQKCDALSQGTSGKNRIRPERFLTVAIPLPPLPEQQRIVAKVEELAAKVEEGKGLRQSSDQQRCLLPANASATIFGNLRCPVLPLADVLKEDSRNGLGTRPSDSPPGVPILRISAGTARADGVVEESDYKFMELSDSDLKTYSLRPGDLLACRFNGNLHFVGRFALYSGYSGQQQVYPDKLIRFRVDDGRVVPEFVRYAMNGRTCRAVIESHCATTAGNIGISATSLKTIPFPVPPLPEQRRIVAYLDDLQAKVDSLKALQAQTHAELDALLPSILDRAFKGEL
jgi:type I restriction enzyme S subunit